MLHGGARPFAAVGVLPSNVRPHDRAARAWADNPEVRSQLRALAAERRRFGYRRLGLLLEREGVRINEQKLSRLY